MNSKRSEIGDEKNTLFDVPEPEFEDLKPGLIYDKVKHRDATDDGHDRFPHSSRKKIPKQSLAERIRKARNGG